jgi:hypothetical protein
MKKKKKLECMMMFGPFTSYEWNKKLKKTLDPISK